MREIKFRGIREDNWQMVYGDLIQTQPNKVDGCFTCWIKPRSIIGLGSASTPTSHFIKVNPETVGQYTGLKDVNGVEIYEGDILSEPISPVGGEDGGYLYQQREIKWLGAGSGYSLFAPNAASKVIGNIHQNPELLERTHG